MVGQTELVIRFASGEPDCNIVSENLAVASVAAQIRKAKGWPDAAHVRLISRGQCLRGEDFVIPEPGSCPTVVHCVKSESHQSTRSGEIRSHIDLLDLLDLRSTICWTFATVLICCWIAYFHFESGTRSVINPLVMCTIAMAGWLSWPAVAPQVEPMLMWLIRCMEYRPCYRVEGEQGGPQGYRDGIPPRPAAPGVAPYGYR